MFIDQILLLVLSRISDCRVFRFCFAILLGNEAFLRSSFSFRLGGAVKGEYA